MNKGDVLTEDDICIGLEFFHYKGKVPNPVIFVITGDYDRADERWPCIEVGRSRTRYLHIDSVRNGNTFFWSAPLTPAVIAITIPAGFTPPTGFYPPLPARSPWLDIPLSAPVQKKPIREVSMNGRDWVNYDKMNDADPFESYPHRR
jgi:hypothetical protein